MHSPTPSFLDQRAHEMREEMNSPSDRGIGSQSPVWSLPASSTNDPNEPEFSLPASPTNDTSEPAFTLGGSDLKVNFFGVAKNDQYLLADGIGAIRGPTKKAEFSFSSSIPLQMLEKAIDLEDVITTALQARLDLSRTELVGGHARATSLTSNSHAFFGNSTMVALDRPVRIVPTREASHELTLFVSADVLFKARVAAALSVYEHKFKNGAALALGYRLTDSAVQLLTGHSAGTIKAALGIANGKDPTRDCVTLSKLEKVMTKHLNDNFSNIAVELETGRIKSGKNASYGTAQGSCGSKRTRALDDGDDCDDGDGGGDGGASNRQKGRASRYNFSSSSSKFVMGHLEAYRSLPPHTRVRLAAKILRDLESTLELSELLQGSATP